MSKPWTDDKLRAFALEQAVKFVCDGDPYLARSRVEVVAESFLTFLLTGHASPQSAIKVSTEAAA